MNTTENKTAEDTRYPKLTEAALSRVERDQLEDVARHGADAGWPGFTYYNDTVAFYKAHKADILAMAKEQASEFGVPMLEMIQGFRCLGKDYYSIDQIGEALYSEGDEGECTALILNAMAWYALEEVARELNPDV